jgi:hypothetical protein
MISVSFFDPITPMDYRILLPVFMAIVVAILLLWYRVSMHVVTQKSFVSVSAILCVLFLGWHTVTSSIIAFDHHRYGLAYTSSIHADILAAAKEVSNDTVIYSNRYDVLFALNKTYIRGITQESDLFHQHIPNGQSTIAIVHFYDVYTNPLPKWMGPSVPISEKDLANHLDFQNIKQTPTGAIYVLAANE